MAHSRIHKAMVQPERNLKSRMEKADESERQQYEENEMEEFKGKALHGR